MWDPCSVKWTREGPARDPRAWDPRDPRGTRGTGAGHEIRKVRGWRRTRAGPAEPAQGGSDGLAATQTIYTALEPAKDLRRTRVGPTPHKGLCHTRRKLPRTPTTLDSRPSLSLLLRPAWTRATQLGHIAS